MVAAAVIGSAVVGAGASVAASGAASRASRRATDRTVAAQEQARTSNLATLQPWMDTGRRASSAIDAMLGNGGTAAAPARPAWSFNGVDYFGDGQGGFTTQAPAATGGQSARAAQDAAFANFRNSTGFQFQQEEGNRAIQAALGRRGQLESRAAVTSAARFNQNLANQSALQYIGLQQEQQRIGLSAANASAGVQTNFANNVSSAFQNQGNAQANAALSVGNAVNSALSSGLGAYTMSQGLRSSFQAPNAAALSAQLPSTRIALGWGN